MVSFLFDLCVAADGVGRGLVDGGVQQRDAEVAAGEIRQHHLRAIRRRDRQRRIARHHVHRARAVHEVPCVGGAAIGDSQAAQRHRPAAGVGEDQLAAAVGIDDLIGLAVVAHRVAVEAALAFQPVAIPAAVEPIVAGVPTQGVGARLAMEQVAARAAVERVGTAAAEERVHAIATGELVAAAAAFDVVGAAEAADHVVAAHAVEAVGKAVPGQRGVVVRGAEDDVAERCRPGRFREHDALQADVVERRRRRGAERGLVAVVAVDDPQPRKHGRPIGEPRLGQLALAGGRVDDRQRLRAGAVVDAADDERVELGERHPDGDVRARGVPQRRRVRSQRLQRIDLAARVPRVDGSRDGVDRGVQRVPRFPADRRAGRQEYGRQRRDRLFERRRHPARRHGEEVTHRRRRDRGIDLREQVVDRERIGEHALAVVPGGGRLIDVGGVLILDADQNRAATRQHQGRRSATARRPRECW